VHSLATSDEESRHEFVCACAWKRVGVRERACAFLWECVCAIVRVEMPSRKSLTLVQSVAKETIEKIRLKAQMHLLPWPSSPEPKNPREGRGRELRGQCIAGVNIINITFSPLFASKFFYRSAFVSTYIQWTMNCPLLKKAATSLTSTYYISNSVNHSVGNLT